MEEMNASMWIAVLLVVVLATSALYVYRLRPVTAGQDKDRGLPRELIGAELLYAEETFRSKALGLVAKVDRAYQIEGHGRLVELKTRARDVVYMSDIIEMSVQRLVVQADTGRPVSMDGWVVVEHAASGYRRPHRVRLLGEREVLELRRRYIQLVTAKVVDPSPARSRRQCEHCGHWDACSATYGDR